MRSFLAFILSLVVVPLISQEGQGYVIRVNNDTVTFKTIELDRKKRGVNCVDHNGRRFEFDAEEVFRIKLDSSLYESALVRVKPLRRKRFVFLRNTVAGKLNLYEFTVRRTKRDWKTVGRNFITLRWIYRAQDARVKYFTRIHFYKKAHESREDMSRHWKKKTRDCHILQEKIKSRSTRWSPGPEELVQFYNRNCRESGPHNN